MLKGMLYLEVFICFDRCKEYVISYILYSHVYMSSVVELYGTELS